MKNYGVTLIGGNYATSGRQKYFNSTFGPFYILGSNLDLRKIFKLFFLSADLIRYF